MEHDQAFVLVKIRMMSMLDSRKVTPTLTRVAKLVIQPCSFDLIPPLIFASLVTRVKIIIASKSYEYENIKSLSGIVSPVVFSMTRKGLEHQFLSLAIKSEKPQLEEDMISSVKKEESLRLKVIALEDELLTLLATSEGNILNNDKLIESLKNSKKSTKEAKKTLDEIKETKVKLEDERNIYFTLAQVGSIWLVGN